MSAETKRMLDERYTHLFPDAQHVTYAEVLKAMTEEMRAHPWWRKQVEGTPLENDLPVRAANVAARLFTVMYTLGGDE